MPRVRGTDVVGLRELFQERGSHKEHEFLAGLTPAQRDFYKNSRAVTWMPLEDNAAIFEAAARRLFPDSASPARELGQAVARITYRGLFQVFLRVPTRDSVIHWAVHLWKAYFDKGDASIENYQEPTGELVVRNFPELPLSLREVVAGHLQVILEETGARDIQVSVPTDHPRAWIWKMRWA